MKNVLPVLKPLAVSLTMQYKNPASTKFSLLKRYINIKLLYAEC